MEKRKTSKKNIIIAVIILLLSAFMVYQPYVLKHMIISSYKENLQKAMNKLDREKDPETEKEKKMEELKGAMASLEEGKTTPYEAGHDTSNFLHKDYFQEPWRDWTNTYKVWERARNYYFLLLLIIGIKALLDHLRGKKYVPKQEGKNVA